MYIIQLFAILLGTLRLSYGLYPVLLVPGDIASQLNARYVKAPPHLLCGIRNEWFTLWINPKYVLPSSIIEDCLVQTMKLNYNATSKKTFPPEYCEVQTPGFGTVDTINYLTTYKIVEYFEAIIKDLEKSFGYIANKNILGAPYDFRKGANEMKDYLKNVKTLIEKMSRDNGGKPVIIIAHSLGNLHLVTLFNQEDQKWKDRYVKTFISISSPSIGAMKSVRSVFSGFQLPIPWFKAKVLKPMLYSWPSTYYLFPSPKKWSKEILVKTKQGNYTAQNIKKLLRLSKIPYAVEHYEENVENMKELLAPNVTTHCIFSRNIPTTKVLDFTAVRFPEGQPKVLYGDGDGTVNLESLKQCGAWKSQQQYPVKEYEILNVKHFPIMTDSRNIATIREIIRKNLQN